MRLTKKQLQRLITETIGYELLTESSTIAQLHMADVLNATGHGGGWERVRLADRWLAFRGKWGAEQIDVDGNYENWGWMKFDKPKDEINTISYGYPNTKKAKILQPEVYRNGELMENVAGTIYDLWYSDDGLCVEGKAVVKSNIPFISGEYKKAKCIPPVAGIHAKDLLRDICKQLHRQGKATVTLEKDYFGVGEIRVVMRAVATKK